MQKSYLLSTGESSTRRHVASAWIDPFVLLSPSSPRRLVRFVFGFRPDVADNVAYTEDGAVVYPAGHNIVLYTPDTKQQRLIPGTLESEGITAMCVSSNRKLLAVAERAEKAIITVYDLQTLKRRKVLTAADTGSKVRPPKQHVQLAACAAAPCQAPAQALLVQEGSQGKWTEASAAPGLGVAAAGGGPRAIA